MVCKFEVKIDLAIHCTCTNAGFMIAVFEWKVLRCGQRKFRDLQACGRKLAKARADFDVKECPINISEHIRTKNIDG